ncbi:MAG: virulence-associated protein VapB [Comamonadaceae bacterium CG_4_9_14_0_8_um_filter_57_21]|nr:MAG: virulence-associated protein VapB [Comamonadaceae bacterium CG2_30_57_122]PIZ23113.1 MAG: virulence-associated protein VapB [Comamonadaceae bacterium CG_4_10_14_0_8_um_filter_57_29]PJC12773.1 MAG: virulence-associated protein VapB [Comamonadaceae bacterium CG_4_9_14_0_8_um_filter_57_21]
MPIALEKIAAYAAESPARQVRLFRNGANQAVRIPKEFELPGKEALIHREGNKLIIEAVKATATTLAEAMKDWEDMNEPFPDVDEGLLPLDDITL